MFDTIDLDQQRRGALDKKFTIKSRLPLTTPRKLYTRFAVFRFPTDAAHFNWGYDPSTAFQQPHCATTQSH